MIDVLLNLAKQILEKVREFEAAGIIQLIIDAFASLKPAEE